MLVREYSHDSEGNLVLGEAYEERMNSTEYKERKKVILAQDWTIQEKQD